MTSHIVLDIAIDHCIIRCISDVHVKQTCPCLFMLLFVSYVLNGF